MKSKSYKSDHALEILIKLNNDRKRATNYCDVSLSAESNDFAAHKCILGVISTFFSKMFSIKMKEKYEGKGKVQGITDETLEAILNFIYTCEITITDANVYSLMEAADYIGMSHLKKFCVEYLFEAIDASNCLNIRAYSKLYNLHGLTEKADVVITKHFASVINGKEFNELKFEVIYELLEVEDKQETSETLVFHGMIQWIKYDINARRQHLTKLFSLIKLENLSGDFLQDVVCQEDLVTNSLKCLRISLQSIVARTRFQLNNQVICKKQNADVQFLAFAENQARKYKLESKESCSLPNCKDGHLNGSAVHHKGKVYVISGRDTKTVERLDLDNQELGWKQLTSTFVERNGGASVILNDCIYNYGGWNGMRSGHCYNIAENKWNRIIDMNHGRYYFSLIATDEVLYAIGGLHDVSILNSVEYYNPLHGSWKIISSMNVGRYGLAAVVLNDKLYVMGGYNGENLKSVERFNPLNQTWCNVAEMNHARKFHGACVLNGKIYVAGGGSPTIEVYDPARDIWEIDENVTDFKDMTFIIST